MPRLIDADALAKDMLFRCNQEIAKYKTMRRALGDVGRAAFDSIKNAPTIDAKPVLRCNMCNHYDTDTGWCDYHYHGMHWDDFCSRGVRTIKEEANHATD